MAVFGAPEELPEKEAAAIRAGLSIIEELRLSAGNGDGSSTDLQVGVGIATGLAFVGNIRAADRWIWSAIGNTTNLAARLEANDRRSSPPSFPDPGFPPFRGAGSLS